MKDINWMIDVAFTVEGPYETFDDIPPRVLLDGMRRRLQTLEQELDTCADAFSPCDSYEV